MSFCPIYKDSTEASRVYLLPNLFTAGNLFCGFLAILRFIQAKYGSLVGYNPVEYYTQGVWLIVFAAILDLFDGRVARLSGRLSLFGAEFDSLADLVSFGVAPALLVFFLILSPSPGNYPQYLDSVFLKFGWLVGFIYLLCCAARLARFNVLMTPLLPRGEKYVDVHDSIGLPVPAAAGIIISIAIILIHAELSPPFAGLLLPIMLLVSVLMISTIPFPVFKHIAWNTRTRFRTFVVVATVVAMIAFLSVYAIAIVFFTYLMSSLFLRRRRLAHWPFQKMAKVHRLVCGKHTRRANGDLM
ncbi:MAG: CDP-alcohol phosphatidyltransferase family protein [Puniceicoccales bacterium]|jgi:CDP-diacylglycerol--serine O-phosphatidyltransferase|nr:CDP-alcohol phosphatidyltransferase family protein [Puniceicoccales bacterium]